MGFKRVDKRQRRFKKKRMIRKKVYGTTERPRLVVFRSLKNIYGQLVDDTIKKTITTVSSRSKELQEQLAREVLFLHGGLSKTQRDRLVERFQNQPGGPPVFILSIKAGGTGVNLTRANHVFHFDRWWNPAVENQATDRAFRIGQSRQVEVHKFICLGTVEERIDELIERKQSLAEKIVGSGESWITELSTDELKNLFRLRTEAVED